MRTILKRSGAWVFARKETSNGWVLVLQFLSSLSFSWDWATFAYSALTGAGADSKKRTQKREWGTADLSGHKKELVALTKQVSDLFDQIERTNRIAFQKKTLDMAISNIAHDIRTPLTIASGYTQQIIKGGTPRKRKS